MKVANFKFINIGDKGIHFSSVMKFFLVCYLLLLAAGMVYVGENRIFDLTTWLLSSALTLTFILAITFCKLEQLPIIGMLSLLFFIYIFPRIAVYLFFPELVVFPFGDNINSEIINHGLLVVLCGTLLSFLGIFIGAYFINDTKLKLNLPNQFLSSSLGCFIGVLLFLLVVDAAITFYSGISIYKPYEKGSFNTLIQLFRIMVDLDVAVFVILVFISIKYMNHGYFLWWIILGIALVYVVDSGLAGSRSGFLRTILMVFSIWIVLKGDFCIPKKLFLIVPVMAILAITFFSFATTQRLVEVRGVEDIPSKSLEIIDSEIEKSSRLTHILPQIINRLGLLDYAILTSSNLGDRTAIQKYMSFKYAAKSIVNTLPGDPFPEAVVNTSRVFPVIYRSVDESYVRSHGVFSEFWTIWGLAVIFFGFAGGMIFLFFLGVFVSIIFNLSRYLGTPYEQLYKIYFVCLILSLIYFSQGLDHTIVVSIISTIRLIIVILLLYFVALLASKVRTGPA